MVGCGVKVEPEAQLSLAVSLRVIPDACRERGVICVSEGRRVVIQPTIKKLDEGDGYNHRRDEEGGVRRVS